MIWVSAWVELYGFGERGGSSYALDVRFEERIQLVRPVDFDVRDIFLGECDVKVFW